jgi:hypothetical protein
MGCVVCGQIHDIARFKGYLTLRCAKQFTVHALGHSFSCCFAIRWMSREINGKFCDGQFYPCPAISCKPTIKCTTVDRFDSSPPSFIVCFCPRVLLARGDDVRSEGVARRDGLDWLTRVFLLPPLIAANRHQI